jgi:hypothetical protein
LHAENCAELFGIQEAESNARGAEFRSLRHAGATSQIGSSAVVIVPVAPLPLRNSKHATLPPPLPMREHGQL